MWTRDQQRKEPHILIFNMHETEQPKKIEGIKVKSSIKYLGVTITTNKQDCFNEHKKNMINKARMLGNQTYPVIAKSCNKVMIGKTFWKSLALPAILYGVDIME